MVPYAIQETRYGIRQAHAHALLMDLHNSCFLFDHVATYGDCRVSVLESVDTTKPYGTFLALCRLAHFSFRGNPVGGLPDSSYLPIDLKNQVSAKKDGNHCQPRFWARRNDEGVAASILR